MNKPVAVLDSGVGGLSVLREIRRRLPAESLIYFADQAHLPYGPRPLEEVRGFVVDIVRFFLAREAKLIVIACNAASAAALHYARGVFPETPFVGMEPAIKPAATNSRTRSIGVITTQATFQGELFASVVQRFAQGVDVVTQVCPEFVLAVEAGELDTPETLGVVRERLAPLLAAGIDQLVLGCTHFPFLRPAIERVIEEAGLEVVLVDPAPAVARQVGRVLAARGELVEVDRQPGAVTYFTTGDVERFAGQVRGLLDETAQVESIRLLSR